MQRVRQAAGFLDTLLASACGIDTSAEGFLDRLAATVPAVPFLGYLCFEVVAEVPDAPLDVAADLAGTKQRQVEQVAHGVHGREGQMRVFPERVNGGRGDGGDLVIHNCELLGQTRDGAAGVRVPEPTWFSRQQAADGIHGVQHYARVCILAELLVRHHGLDDEHSAALRLAAAIHDCCRHNDQTDPEHGQRAADWLAGHHQTVTGAPAQGVPAAPTRHPQPPARAPLRRRQDRQTRPHSHSTTTIRTMKKLGM
ncbi:hypothetical protein [Nonomuraea fuscirosea]|uniref:hypothetical protein n=1 Tax=Nonomuraea fuscirosea TaxID=1291556 RepID=UPI0033F77CDF